MSIYEIVKKLVGEIEPVGSTEEDEKRFKNLETMTHLLNALLTDVDSVSRELNDKSHSVSKAGRYAKNFLDYIGIEQ